MTVDLRRPPAKGSIATWRDLRQPCVPACSSPALRPGPFLPSLASNVLFQHHFLRSNITSALDEGPAKIEHTFEKLLNADQFEIETYKTLMIVVGASGKGLGAAGIEIDAELQRVLLLAQKAREYGTKIIVGNLEGESRRGSSSDEILLALAPYANALFAKVDANQDDLFTKISEERSIPLKLFEKTVDLVEVLNEFFVR